jgi:hypothetical protein
MAGTEVERCPLCRIVCDIQKIAISVHSASIEGNTIQGYSQESHAGLHVEGIGLRQQQWFCRNLIARRMLGLLICPRVIAFYADASPSLSASDVVVMIGAARAVDLANCERISGCVDDLTVRGTASTRVALGVGAD